MKPYLSDKISSHMKKYTLTFVLSTSSEKSVGEVEKLIKSLSGGVNKKTEMGRKTLAYLIKKQPEGLYFDWEIELDPISVNSLKSKLNLMPEVLRYLVLLA